MLTEIAIKMVNEFKYREKTKPLATICVHWV